MRNIFLFLTALALTANSFSQKNIHVENADKRNITSFHAINAATGIDVYISKDNTESLIVSSNNADIVKYIKTEVENGVLKIYREPKLSFMKSFSGNVKVYVAYKNINALKASSGASIYGEDFNTDNLSAHVSSGGEIKLQGRTSYLTVDGNSGGTFKGFDLEVDSSEATVSSGADIKLKITKELTAKASSGGTIRYSGNCALKLISVSSGGEIKKVSKN